MRQKEVDKGGQKGAISEPNISPNCPIACPRATTSIILNLNMALCFVHGEKKLYGNSDVPSFFINPLWTTLYLQHFCSSALVNEKYSLYGFAGHQMRGYLNFSPNQLTPHSLIHPT